MTIDADVAISGGGIIGTTLALALAGGGMSVLLIDRSTVRDRRSDEFDGRAYALSLSSCRILGSLGLSAPLKDHGQEFRFVCVTDGRVGGGASPSVLRFDADDLQEGPMATMLEDRFLRRALLDHVAATPSIRHESPAALSSYQAGPSSVQLRLEAGKSFTARIIAGCDGRYGPVAREFPTSRVARDYRQSAMVCAVEHELPHEGGAWQFFMPTGPLAILPLPQNRSSIVWTDTTENADRMMALSDADFMAEFRLRFGDFLGRLRLASKRYCWPLSLSLAEATAAARSVLVGDAALGLHPLAGQGLNLGLRDVASLAETLIDAQRRGEDIGAIGVLRRYQDWRQLDLSSFAFATDFLNWIYSSDSEARRQLRRTGMQFVGNIPMLRRILARNAAGIAGDLPRLAAGMPI